MILTAIFITCIILFTGHGTIGATVYERLDEWTKYKLKFRKHYTGVEDVKRRLVWEDRKMKIDEHNKETEKGLHTYTIGINEFSDLTNAEFKRLMLGYKSTTDPTNDITYVDMKNRVNIADIPDEINWKQKGWVTAVGNQGPCGSCWAFTANGAVEGQHFNKTGKLVALSAQNLMDCSQKEGNYGCEGGLMVNSYEYIIKNKGIDTDASYPYTGKNEKCKFKRGNVGATLTGYVKLKPGDEEELKIAVATIGPIAMAMDGTHESFEMYKSGIYDEPKCGNKTVNHSMVIVGYGTLNGKDYWLMKNSWGTTWGMDGYIMMARNKNNQCGLASQCSYPIV